MSYKYQGDAVMYASLTVEAPRPLDTRTVVDGIENLYDIPASSAYQGMTVANINDGNLYMLIDKNKISEKAGWKASYESIQIITCTQVEYDTWDKNTTEDYKPIDSTLPYLRRDVYYYIYEDEENSQYYVTKKQIEDWLSAKASVTSVEGLSTIINGHIEKYNKDLETLTTSINGILTTIDSNYLTSEEISQIYATQESLTATDNKFANYYTQQQVTEILNDYVTKESLRGEDVEGDDFIFVTQAKYELDKLNNLEKFTTKAIALLVGENNVDITASEDAVLVNNKELAFKEYVPKIEVKTKEAYDEIVDKDPDVYYFITDDDIVGYITYDEAVGAFYTKGEINNMIAKAQADVEQKMLDDYIKPLQERIAALESSQV